MPELRHALRVLTRSPGPSVVVVLTLALGLGANIAIFSLVRGVLLRPLPYEAPERLVRVSNFYGDREGSSISIPELFFYRQTSGAVEGLAGISDAAVTLADGGEPVRALAGVVSPSLFPLLGVEAAHGRVFRPEEEQPGREPVVILSHGLWQRRFAGDPSVVGRSLSIDGAPHLVVGVMPSDFQSVMGLIYPGYDAELWQPLPVDPATFSRQRAEVHNLVALARLAPGMDPKVAETSFAPAVRQLEETYPEISGAGRRSVRLHPLSEVVTTRARPTLLLLLGAVAFVLLIACANVANLRLVAALVRRREIAVRRALGAAPGRLVRQMLAESLVLSLAGGVLGVLLALWGVDALRAVLPAEVPRLGGGPLDAQVLGFGLVLVLVTGVLAGLAPALFARGVDLTPALRSGDVRSGADRRSLRLKTVLVAAEVAVAATLLVGAGLLLHSLWRLQRVDPGVDTAGVLTLDVHLPAARYDEPSKVIAFHRRMTDEVRTLPGVESAGMIHHLPPLQYSDWPFQTEDGEWTGADPNLVTRNTFDALGIPLVRGRGLTEADFERPGAAVLLNETAAREAFGEDNPLGRRINIDFGEPVWREVVGVVADVKSRGLGAPMRPQTWFPLTEGLPLHAPRSMTLVARGGGDLHDLGRQIRRRIATLDPEVAVSDVRPMSEAVAATLTEPRVTSWLLGAFAVVALALAALGIYGVLAFAVAGRIPELGLRMALGARRADVLGLILRQGLTVIAVGLGLGLAASLALGRLLSRWLFEIHAADPLTLALACVPMAAVALLACWLPARRAARVDPMVALRWE